MPLLEALATDLQYLESALERSPIVVSAKTLLRDAIALMSAAASASASGSHPQTRSSCVLVMEASQLLGLLSARDVVHLTASQRDFTQVTVGDILTQPAIALDKSKFQGMFALLALFRQHQINHLPLLDERGGVLGVLTPESIRRVLPVTNYLKFRSVADVMSLQVACTSATASVLSLVSLMDREQVSYVVIVDTEGESGRKPLGIVTEQDIVRFQALNLDLAQTPVEAVMSTPLLCVKPEDSLWVAHQQMQQHQVGELGVCGTHGELLGLLTQSNIQQAVDPSQMYKAIDRLQRSIKRLEAEKVELLKNRNAELERLVSERTAELQEQAECDRLLGVIADRIRQSLDLKQILTATVSEVRQFLQTHRVMIYRFDAETRQGIAVVESVDPRWGSMLELPLSQTCFTQTTTEVYQTGCVRDIENIYTLELNTCDPDLLKRFDIQANLVVPILQQEEAAAHTVWGLLVAHHCETPRKWRNLEIAFLQRLSTQVAIAIQQSSLFEQVKLELAERKQAEAQIRRFNSELEQRVRERTQELLATNAQLQESKERFQNLVEQTNDWVWEFNTEFVFTYVNPQVQNLIGYPPDRVLGKTIFDFVSKDEAQRLTTVLDYVTAEKEAFTNLEKTLIHHDGHEIVFETSGSPLFDVQGIFQGYRGIARDITERKRVEREIRKALTKEKELNELKSRFVTLASHEFRTPLTTILASAESLEYYNHKWSEEKKVSYLKRIQVTVQHMTDMLNDVLLIGKAEAGKLTFNPQPLMLEQFCQEIVEEIKLGNKDKHDIKLIKIGECGSILGDEKVLRHILLNLLSNAIKYSPNGGEVNFKIACENDLIVLEVKDSGIGIPVDDQKRLFEPFHRAKNVSNISGTGLGLAIVKNSAKVHGGRVKVKSEVGVGTTFTVTLPLKKGM